MNVSAGELRRRAVFLDRDGVLNKAVVKNGKPYPPASLTDLQICADAPQSLADLRRHGFLLIVVTNQPDVARGTQQRETVEEMNRSLGAALPLDDFLVCYHDARDNCDCRKPRPGLLLRAAAELKIDLQHSYMVGDRWRDVDAGHNAGCQTILIDYGYNEQYPERQPAAKVKSLREAADAIIRLASQGTICEPSF
ncbi:MAG: HAD family hydrolase [Acidobacteriaceae bacterium]|nr:HAD family hydrolase [Acidobacteriaceae bacterium]